MATLLTPLRARATPPTAGERRLAERLTDKLDDDYLVWFDVPVGPLRTHPDFVVLHPRRGILVVETKDWALDTIVRVDRELWDIAPGGHHKRVVSPLEQARHGALAVVDALKRDPALVHHDGRYAGQMVFPWGYGVVLTRITRAQFTASGMGQAIDADSVICSDEMTEGVDPEDFQRRLWGFFRHRFDGALSLPQLDRVRWILFPEVRVRPAPGALFAGTDAVEPSQSADAQPRSGRQPPPTSPPTLDLELPDVMAVMDLQQEQLARSLGTGHRIIHGVAGSGKTMILGYRAEYLARTSGPGSPPILALCFNEPLAVALAAGFRDRGIADRVHAVHFHRWCHRQLTAYGLALPADGDDFPDRLVDAVARGVERGHIPTGQYQAVLVDEGHDFRPEWLRLVVRMVDPETNSLLVLYDDAQNIYERSRATAFSFKSVGIQAQGRTTILRINYRNTTQILRLAQRIAAGLLDPQDCDEDGIPLLAPRGCGREGPQPRVERAADLPGEAALVGEWLVQAYAAGRAWADMAIVGPDLRTLRACGHVLHAHKVPYAIREKSGDFRPGQQQVTLLTMRVSKGLEFPLVAIAGLGRLPGPDQQEAEAARLVYVAATRATEELLVTVSGDGPLGQRLGV